MTGPTWQDLSPEQAHETARFRDRDERDSPRMQAPRVFGLCCLGALVSALALRELKPRPTCADPRLPTEHEQLQAEYMATIRAHRAALRRVKRRAEESARLARNELDELSKARFD